MSEFVEGGYQRHDQLKVKNHSYEATTDFAVADRNALSWTVEMQSDILGPDRWSYIP